MGSWAEQLAFMSERLKPGLFCDQDTDLGWLPPKEERIPEKFKWFFFSLSCFEEILVILD